MNDDDMGQLVQLFKDATAQQDGVSKRTVTKQISLILLSISLVCTTIPYAPLSIFGSIGVIVCGAICLRAIITRGVSVAWHTRVTVSALVLFSLLSGCSPLILDEPSSYMLDICSDTGQCKSFDLVGYSVFGIPIRSASVEQAQMFGRIKEIKGIQEKTGYGLVSFTKFRIYGS